MNKNVILCLLIGFAFFYSSCKKDETAPEIKTIAPEIKTIASGSITDSSAIAGVEVISEGTSKVTERGVCWNTTGNPTINDIKIATGNGTDSFSVPISGLKPFTVYYLRAYAISSAGIGYGETWIFKTLHKTIGQVIDIDGNIYNTVVIGKQAWMVENLKVTHYRNGDSILPATDVAMWKETLWLGNNPVGAYCNLSNVKQLSLIYGQYYNWKAVHDSRGLAPVGWHVPTRQDWTTLLIFIATDGRYGPDLLFESGANHWYNDYANITGFTALPGGFFSFDGLKVTQYGKNMNAGAVFWVADPYDYDDGYYIDLPNTVSSWGSPIHGLNVRCVKD